MGTKTRSLFPVACPPLCAVFDTYCELSKYQLDELINKWMARFIVGAGRAMEQSEKSAGVQGAHSDVWEPWLTHQALRGV